MRSKVMFIMVSGFLLAYIFYFTPPSKAVTDGPTRQTLEANLFSELLIKSAIYPKSSHDVYSTEKRRYVHGLPNINKKLIYEPDVYTWEVAMAAHRKQVFDHPTTMDNPPESISPVPMTPGAIMPILPEQVQLTPLGPDTMTVKPVPADAHEKMQRLLQRAQAMGLNPQNQLQTDSIKQRLINHMNSLNTQQTPTPETIPGMISPMQGLPQNMPAGRAADSYDQNYDQDY